VEWKLYQEEEGIHRIQRTYTYIGKWKLGKIDRREYMKERRKFKELKEKKQKEKREKEETELKDLKREEDVWKFINKKRDKRIWRDNIETEEWKHFMNLLNVLK